MAQEHWPTGVVRAALLIGGIFGLIAVIVFSVGAIKDYCT